MPDEPWVNLSGQDSADYEKNSDQGQPPAPGFKPWGGDNRVQLFKNGASIDLRTDYFVNWTVQPPPQAVSIRCAKCAEHIHTTVGDVPEADQIHASEGSWLERDGLRFKNAKVTGTELKRTLHVMIKPDGTELVRITLWSRRQVDQVKNGIEWEWGDFEFECVDGLPFSGYASLLDQGTTMATTLADATLVGGAQPPTVLLGGFLPLLVQASNLRGEASFRVESQADEQYLVLSEKRAGGNVVEVARQRLHVLKGTTIVQASGGFKRQAD